MRRIEHPGPVAAERHRLAACGLKAVHVALPAGAPLLDALAALLEQHGARSAVASLRGGGFMPFVYVMPALSRTAEHAVYFSDRHELPQGVRLEEAQVTFGRRGDSPWLHCHGIWVDAQGRRLAGHVLPNEAVIAAPIDAAIWFLVGAEFQVLPSDETRFQLFEPVASGERANAQPEGGTFSLTVRPNEDICTALEDVCRARGVTHARLRGGVGSLVGARFDDGRTVEPFVTEAFVREGRIVPDAEGLPRAQLDVAVVDYLGGLNEGRLQRGANPVLVTFEMVVEPVAADEAVEVA